MGMASDGATTGVDEAGTITAGADPVPAIEAGAAELDIGSDADDAGTTTSGRIPVEATALDAAAGTTGRTLELTLKGAEDVAGAAGTDVAGDVGVEATGTASGLVMGVETGVTDDVEASSPSPPATDCTGSAADDVAGIVPFVTI